MCKGWRRTKMSLFSFVAWTLAVWNISNNNWVAFGRVFFSFSSCCCGSRLHFLSTFCHCAVISITTWHLHHHLTDTQTAELMFQWLLVCFVMVFTCQCMNMNAYVTRQWLIKKRQNMLLWSGFNRGHCVCVCLYCQSTLVCFLLLLFCLYYHIHNSNTEVQLVNKQWCFFLLHWYIYLI